MYISPSKLFLIIFSIALVVAIIVLIVNIVIQNNLLNDTKKSEEKDKILKTHMTITSICIVLIIVFAILVIGILYYYIKKIINKLKKKAFTKKLKAYNKLQGDLSNIRQTIFENLLTNNNNDINEVLKDELFKNKNPNWKSAFKEDYEKLSDEISLDKIISMSNGFKENKWASNRILINKNEIGNEDPFLGHTAEYYNNLVSKNI